MAEKKQTVTTASGLPENAAGALAYFLGPITGILFLVLEKSNQFVRFHAMQSLITFGGLFVVNIVLGIVPVLGWVLGRFLSLAGLLLWVVLLVKAYQGEKYKLPYIGKMAEKQLNRISAD